MSTALYELYDSDNPLSIPVGVRAAGYDDGYAAIAWAAYGWARFPDALHITVFGNTDSDIDDVESGGDTPADTPNFASGRRARGKVAIIYVNRSNGHLVEQYLRGAGFTQAEVVLWIGTDDGTEIVTHWIDGTPVYYPVWAVQYLNPSHGSGGHYDRSLVYLAFAPGGGTIGGDMAFTRADTDGLADIVFMACMGDRVRPEDAAVEFQSAYDQIVGAANLRGYFENVYNDPRSVAYRAAQAKIAADVEPVPPPAVIPPGTPITFTGTVSGEVTGSGTTK